MLDGYSWAMVVVFVIGYALITLEHIVNINKSTTAIIMAIVCWVIQFLNPHVDESYNTMSLGHHLAGIAQVVFFLLGALIIVETISAHKGFKMIANFLTIRSKRSLLWIIGFITFFLSAILDNLTSTIVMITLIRKLIDDPKERLFIGGAIVIAANAGGAWTPIGDVTTTMLWIGGQLSTFSVMGKLFLPSAFCCIASFLWISRGIQGILPDLKKPGEDEETEPNGQLVFFIGLASLIFVPVFKILTGLPPFMGILLALGILWAVTDYLHQHDDSRVHLRIPHILSKVDIAGTLFFFLGILLCIDALDTAHILQHLAEWLNQSIGNLAVIATLIGFASAVVDNVPLVAATMGMYDLSQYPIDHRFWDLVAYCAGTGGSILIIGSAAGVVFMGMEKVDFYWYLKRVSLPAALGYAGGIIVYLLQEF